MRQEKEQLVDNQKVTVTDMIFELRGRTSVATSVMSVFVIHKHT